MLSLTLQETAGVACAEQSVLRADVHLVEGRGAPQAAEGVRRTVGPAYTLKEDAGFKHRRPTDEKLNPLEPEYYKKLCPTGSASIVRQYSSSTS
ncbi:hypothetical protein DIPPA_20375 [Diplonema papillatum]|nr:hypothetical protein DIPPA_20375 [Diplonema papillatum]